MLNSKKILAIIPARGGSKKIKNKNIVKIKKKPLLGYTIEQALKSKYIDEICLSSDSIKIINIAKSFGLNVFFKRPKILSTDALEKSKKYFKKKFDYFILLQPTCPLRKSFHIDQSIKKLINSKHNSLISICDVDGYHPNRMKVIKKNLLFNYSKKKSEDMRPRQKLPKVFIRNGAIYLTKVSFFEKKKIISDKTSIPYLMEQDNSINIDGPLDLELAKILLS